MSKTAIPAGRIKTVLPEIHTEAVEKIKVRDQLRQTDLLSPHIEELNSEITNAINEHKREKWRSKVGNINRKVDSGKLFKLIKLLRGSIKTNDNQAIKFKGKYLTNPSKIANAFNKQYLSVKDHKSSKTARKQREI